MTGAVSVQSFGPPSVPPVPRRAVGRPRRGKHVLLAVAAIAVILTAWAHASP
jgi:hypothetical protein